MKRYGHLWGQIVNRDNLYRAHLAASKGKRQYRQVRRVNQDLELHLTSLMWLLDSGEYRTSQYTPRILNERGKERLIHRLPYWPDRVVHHAFVQVLSPIWRKSMIRHSYASIPGRGIHDAQRHVLAALRDDPAGTAYCLKMDIRKFYPSIGHDELIGLLARKIKDPRVMAVLEEVIRSLDVTAPGVGVPIGNYFSQWFANIYLTPYDWRAKQHYGIKHYFRYCDDIVMLNANKDHLHAVRHESATWLADNFRLAVKDNWQVWPTLDRGVDFVGYRMWPEKVLLRKGTKKRMAAKLSPARGARSQEAFRQGSLSLPSYQGWVQHGSTHSLQHKLLTPWWESQ
jgi:hypothetical protein